MNTTKQMQDLGTKANNLHDKIQRQLQRIRERNAAKRARGE